MPVKTLQGAAAVAHLKALPPAEGQLEIGEQLKGQVRGSLWTLRVLLSCSVVLRVCFFL